MAKTYSIVPLDDLSTLAGLLIKFGGEFPLFADRRRVWLRAKVNGAPANSTSPISDLVEPTKDYFLDMATLAAKLYKQLIEHAANHARPPLGESISHSPPRAGFLFAQRKSTIPSSLDNSRDRNHEPI